MASQVLKNTYAWHPMQPPFSHYRPSAGHQEHLASHASHATRGPDAALVSQIRRWHSPSKAAYFGLLAGVDDIHPKMSWIKQPARPSQRGNEPGTAARNLYLMVEACDSSHTPCYDSDTEEGIWEMDTSAGWPRLRSNPYIAIMDPATAYAGLIHDHENGADGFSGTSCHVFEASGRLYLLSGASRQLKGCLSHRLRAYCLEELAMLEPQGADSSVVNPGDYDWQWYLENCKTPPILQQQVHWQASAKSASMAGHSRRVAWQTGPHSFRVMDALSLIQIAQVNIGSMVAEGSQIISLQWSSCGGYLALLCRNAASRQIMLWETQGWQRIWDAEKQGKDVKMSWAPTEPSLAILHSNVVQVLHVSGAHVTYAQQSIGNGTTSRRTCRWDPSSRYLVVLPMWVGYEIGQAAVVDARTARHLFTCQVSAGHWPEWLELGTLLGKGPTDSSRPQPDSNHEPLPSLQQCFVHEPAGLINISRQGHSRKSCGARWSHMSPDGSLITTLLARIVGCSRAVFALQHYNTASDKHINMLPFLADLAEDAEEPERKPHPFLCAWLPGTTIYAAAALGFVVIVDGELNVIIKMWPADAFEMRKEDWQQRTRLVTCCPEDDVTGLSWSPDGLSIAWLHQSTLRLISFQDGALQL